MLLYEQESELSEAHCELVDFVAAYLSHNIGHMACLKG